MLSVVVKIDIVRTPAVTFRSNRQRNLGLHHNTLSIYSDFIFLKKIETFMCMEVTERTQQQPFICLKGNTSYIYDDFICEIKNIILSCILISKHTRPSLPICILTSKLTIESLNPHSDLDLSRRNPSLVRDTPYIYVISYIKEKLKSFHAL
jgi:hypothetical protein